MPTADDRTPTFLETAFDCPRCSAYAQQDWGDLLVERDGGNWNQEAIDTRSPLVGQWRMSICGHCEDASVWRDNRLIYPAVGVVVLPHSDMPPVVRELYEEAREVVGVSRRAGAALARATLERMLKELDPEAGRVDLAKRIERIMGRVSTPLGEMLTVIRHVGNKSLHTEDEPDDAVVLVLDRDQTDIVDLMFETINDLVDELITRPARVAKMHNLVPDRIRKMVKGPNSATN